MIKCAFNTSPSKLKTAYHEIVILTQIFIWCQQLILTQISFRGSMLDW